MSDYVSRQYLLDEYDHQHQGPPGGARKIIAEAPAEDVVPVVHGKWNKLSYDGFNCNKCGSTFVIMQGKENMHLCPNCGAKMDAR